MFIEKADDENERIINLDQVGFFLKSQRIVEETIIPLIRFTFPDDEDICWKFYKEEERDKTLQNIRENLINKRGYAKV